MFTLIKGGTLYGPEKMGVKDLLVVGRAIAKVADQIDLPGHFRPLMISARNRYGERPADGRSGGSPGQGNF